MEPAFVTERLRVFVLKAVPNELVYNEKEVYIAFRTDDEVAYPVCIVTLDRQEGVQDYDFVEWIETMEGHRREGLAMELLRGLDTHLGPNGNLQMDGATDAGEALTTKFYD